MLSDNRNISLISKHTSNIILKCQIHGGDKSHWWVSFTKTKKKWEKHISFKQACLNFELWTEVVFMRWHQIKARVFTKAGMPPLHEFVLFFLSCTLMIISFLSFYGNSRSSAVTQKGLVTVGWYFRDRNRQVSVAKDRERDSRYL